jgi:glycosyltransferase involved in cell wall biosynthesis
MIYKKKVGIVGTHGLPANYSGWETLVKNLVNYRQNIDYLIATPSSRKSQQNPEYKRMSVYIPLKASGWQSIFYDLVSTIVLLRKCDSILILGVSGCIFLPIIKLFTNKDIVVNTDGVEYKREKWGFLASNFLKISEMIAVKYATRLVADNRGIDDYIQSVYNRKVNATIAYGGVTFIPKKPIHLDKYNFTDKSYDIAIARIVPENNIEIILSAYNDLEDTLIFIGNWDTSDYSLNLKSRKWNSNIHIMDADYNENRITSLRKACRYYIHGHSAGGTNPSLVEALSIGCNILCYDVNFNRYVLEDNAAYWSSKNELSSLISCELDFDKEKMQNYYQNNFDWKIIANKYESIL